MKLTKHFKERWRERFGYIPTSKQIEKLVNKGKFIQSRQVLWNDRYKKPYKVLRVVMLSDLGVCVKLDRRDGKDIAVTVI